MGHNATDRLHRITAPTLVITGDADRLIPPANSDAPGAAHPRREAGEDPGRQPRLQLRDAETFNRDVLDFLATVER